MTAERFSTIDDERNRIEGNYEKADKALAQKWNEIGKDGKNDWQIKDVENWMKNNDLVRHENNDMKTEEYIPRRIHEVCTHSGGVCECKKRDQLINGGGFDE